MPLKQDRQFRDRSLGVVDASRPAETIAHFPAAAGGPQVTSKLILDLDLFRWSFGEILGLQKRPCGPLKTREYLKPKFSGASGRVSDEQLRHPKTGRNTRYRL